METQTPVKLSLIETLRKMHGIYPEIPYDNELYPNGTGYHDGLCRHASLPVGCYSATDNFNRKLVIFSFNTNDKPNIVVLGERHSSAESTVVVATVGRALSVPYDRELFQEMLEVITPESIGVIDAKKMFETYSERQS